MLKTYFNALVFDFQIDRHHFPRRLKSQEHPIMIVQIFVHKKSLSWHSLHSNLPAHPLKFTKSRKFKAEGIPVISAEISRPFLFLKTRDSLGCVRKPQFRIQSQIEARVTRSKNRVASFSYRVATARFSLIRWKKFSTWCRCL